MSARRKTLQNSADDYSKIVDLLSRFAIHHTHVSFSCRKVGCYHFDALYLSYSQTWRKEYYIYLYIFAINDQHGAARADVHSVGTPSRLDAIRSVYGVSVAQNLMKIEDSDNDPSSSVFKMDGLISNFNFVAKKITMVLFINGIYHSFSATVLVMGEKQEKLSYVYFLCYPCCETKFAL